MLNDDIIDAMVRKAMESIDHAYVAHSKLAVGACALTGDGTLYGGCNIDNTSPSIYCTAEALAIYKAISDGKREFDAVAVIADTDRPFVPCGSSLQLMTEFGVYELVMANMNGEVDTVRLSEFFPSGDMLMENHRYIIPE